MFQPPKPFLVRSAPHLIIATCAAGSSLLAGQYSATLPFSSDLRATVPIVDLPPTSYTINSVTGADRFYTEGYTGFGAIVANAEAGHIWGGTDSSAPAGSYEAGHSFLRGRVSRYVGSSNFSPGFPVEYDFHATMVGHALGGAGPLTGSSIGIAPFSELWSGSVATSFGSPGADRPSGSFTVSDSSLHGVYNDFFNGANPTGRRADVVNSSWGGGDDTDASGLLARATDALAFKSPGTTFVVSAGNDGPDSNTVTDMSAGYNNIAVAALTGPWSAKPFREVADFSSRGPSDFFNPDTLELVKAVRATVDIAAPGEDLRLAAYLHPTGGNSDVIGSSNPFDPLVPGADSSSFILSSGTSFASPITAGGVGLLKEVAYTLYGGSEGALDSRVMKSVLQASADHHLVGWNNGQFTDEFGVVRTEQALDFRYGAGGLDLERAFETYASEDSTADVPGLADDGLITRRGWDFGCLSYDDTANIYLFDRDLAGLVSITLNWFVERSYSYMDRTGEITAEDLSFANLDLELWTVDENGNLAELFATSESLYNNTEHLFVRLVAGRYAIKVNLDDFVYGGADFVNFGLAWAVPESSASTALAGVGFAWMAWTARRRSRRSGQ